MPATLLGVQRIRTVTVIPETADGLVEAWAFDVVDDMQETNPGQAFRHALQNGQEGITDGTRLEPEELQVSGIVSDTPIRFLVNTGRHPGAVALYEQIKEIRRRQTPVAVQTSWAGLKFGMWPEVITGTHGAQQGASIGTAINFVKFNRVFTQLVPSQVDSDILLLGSQTVSVTQG